MSKSFSKYVAESLLQSETELKGVEDVLLADLPGNACNAAADNLDIIRITKECGMWKVHIGGDFTADAVCPHDGDEVENLHNGTFEMTCTFQPIGGEYGEFEVVSISIDRAED